MKPERVLGLIDAMMIKIPFCKEIVYKMYNVQLTMDNEQWTVDNWGIPFGDDYESCRRHTIIVNSQFSIVN